MRRWLIPVLLSMSMGVSDAQAQQNPFQDFLNRALRDVLKPGSPQQDPQPSQPQTPTSQPSPSQGSPDTLYILTALSTALETGGVSRDTQWHNPTTGSSGVITPLTAHEYLGGNTCRMFRRTWSAGGQSLAYEGKACRQPSGWWVVQQEQQVPITSVAQTPTNPVPNVQPASEPAAKAGEPVARSTNQLIAEAQTLLTQLGYDPGPGDGVYGGNTRRAIEAFQRAQGLLPDGQVSDGLITRLRMAASQIPSPIILAIDGIDRWASQELQALSGLLIEGRAISYLEPAIKSAWDFVNDKDVHYAPWSGNYADTPKFIDSVKGITRLVAQMARRDKRPLAIVAHSWGSVLAYRAIDELYREGTLQQGDVDQLITFGSPLNSRNPIALMKARQHIDWRGASAMREPVREWRNYWIEEDGISNAIPELGKKDIQLPYSEIRDGKAHEAYYSHEKSPLLWNKIGLDLRNALAAAAPQLPTAATSGSGATTQPQTNVIEQPVYGRQTGPPSQTTLAKGQTSAATPACTGQRSKNVAATKTSGDYERGVDLYGQADYAAAYKLWLPLANNGDARAQTMIGELYKNAWGVEFDARKAERWHLMAAEQGYPEGQYNLGVLYVQEWGVKDCNKGMAWVHKAANQGHAKAHLLLARIYSGQGYACVPRDVVKTYMWATLAGASDDRDIAQQARGLLDLLGDIAQQERGVVGFTRTMTPTQIAQAKEQARLLKQKIAQTPSVEAQGPRSSGQSDFYWAMAAYNSKDYPTVFQILEPLANTGDACAQHMLGFLHDKGFGVPADVSKARDWYQKAAAQGDAEAVQRLAIAARAEQKGCFSGICVGDSLHTVIASGTRWTSDIKKSRENFQGLRPLNPGAPNLKNTELRQLLRDGFLGLTDSDVEYLLSIILSSQANWTSPPSRYLDVTALNMLSKIRVLCNYVPLRAMFLSTNGYETVVTFVPYRNVLVVGALTRTFGSVPSHQISLLEDQLRTEFTNLRIHALTSSVRGLQDADGRWVDHRKLLGFWLKPALDQGFDVGELGELVLSDAGMFRFRTLDAYLSKQPACQKQSPVLE